MSQRRDAGRATVRGAAARPPARATATVDLNQSAVARYIQLATLFRRHISQGVWPVGAQMPTVDALAAEYGVARATIRQALDLLEADGLIERFRAKGTFVREARQEPLWCEVQTDWTGLLKSRPGATIEILANESGATAPAVAADLGRPAPSYRRLRRRHWRDGQPFLLADLYLDDRLWPKVTAEALMTRTALNLIAGLPGVRVADARQTLTIGSADVESAAQLMIPLNAPVAYVRRVAIDQDGWVMLVADGIYRGDVVRLDVKLATAT